MSSTVRAPPQGTRQQEVSAYVKDTGGRNLIDLGSKVRGMTILDRNLFAVCQKPPNILFKFDLDASDKSFSRPDGLGISDMVYPRGIAASEKLSCLYITDWSQNFGGKLWRYTYKKGEETRAAALVATLDVQPFGVSVSPTNDEVLVTCATQARLFNRRGWIYIYTSRNNDFFRARIIDLPGLEIPRHAILTSSSQFIVCHGWSAKECHGVTSFKDNQNGSFSINTKCFYGRAKGSGSGIHEMDRPLSLAFYNNQMVLVVDYHNHRVQLLTEDLQLVRHLLTKEEHSIKYPRHVCRDPRTGRIFVGLENGEIHIFEER